jgi:hypothetical protein
MYNYVAVEQREGHRKHSLTVFLSLGLFVSFSASSSRSHPQVKVLKANIEENINLDQAATSGKLATGKREQAGAKNARKVHAKILECKTTQTKMHMYANVCACVRPTTTTMPCVPKCLQQGIDLSALILLDLFVCRRSRTLPSPLTTRKYRFLFVSLVWQNSQLAKGLRSFLLLSSILFSPSPRTEENATRTGARRNSKGTSSKIKM